MSNIRTTTTIQVRSVRGQRGQPQHLCKHFLRLFKAYFAFHWQGHLPGCKVVTDYVDIVVMESTPPVLDRRVSGTSGCYCPWLWKNFIAESFAENADMLHISTQSNPVEWQTRWQFLSATINRNGAHPTFWKRAPPSLTKNPRCKYQWSPSTTLLIRMAWCQPCSSMVHSPGSGCRTKNLLRWHYRWQQCSVGRRHICQSDSHNYKSETQCALELAKTSQPFTWCWSAPKLLDIAPRYTIGKDNALC